MLFNRLNDEIRFILVTITQVVYLILFLLCSGAVTCLAVGFTQFVGAFCLGTTVLCMWKFLVGDFGQ